MTEEHLASGTEPDGTDPAVELIQELLLCGWIADSAASASGTVRAVNLASPSRSLTLRVKSDGDRVQLVFDAPTRGGHRFRYAWAATAPVLPAQVVLAVAAANDADATFGFDENDAVDLDFLTAAGWRQEHDSRWEHPDGRVLQAQAGDPKHPWVSITIGHDGDEHPIRATQHTSNQVLQALTDDDAPEPAAAGDTPQAERQPLIHFEGRWQPTSTAVFRRILLRHVADEKLAEKAEAQTFTVPPSWHGSASDSERGQQHVRLALALTGTHAPLDSPELFDQVAETIPAVIADLHALARRIGLDPERLPAQPRVQRARHSADARPQTARGEQAGDRV